MLDSVLEFITDPNAIPHSEALDRCLRLNGELITLPQNEEEEKAMDNVLWDFLLKRVENNMTKLIKDGPSVFTYVAAVTRMVEENSVDAKFKQMGFDVNSKQQTYPPNGELDLVHPYTGAPLKRHRPGFVWPQMMTYYKFPQLCLACISSMKDPKEGQPWREHKESICPNYRCTVVLGVSFICMFSQEPTFSVRGLCKDAVMDSQYKLADHIPGSVVSIEFDTRSYVGPKGWTITRNKTDKKWRMSHYYYTDLTLTMLDGDALPVGKHKWLAENNVCNEGKTSTVVLQLSGCSEDQFTCDDGKCLDISQRCNNIEVISLSPN